MSTESLIVELDAKTQKMDAKLKAATKRLDELDGGAKKADTSLAKMGKAAGAAGQIAIKTAAAVAALSAAVTAMVVSSAKGRRELELLATQAKTSTENFQALSFATGQYGINAEQIADISKDVSDKVGEFARDATGPFQDFANQMKLTKSQAKDLAVEFQDMSSEEVIGRMVKMMEEAGTSGDQMTQVLESMGNDLSKLKPLFSDNAKELNKLKDRFNDVNESLQITDVQAEKLKNVAQRYDLMTTSVGNATTAISATLAPVMDDFFNDVIEIVPTATQAIIDFANSFLEAENISSLSGVRKEISDTESEVKRLTFAHETVTKAIEDQNVAFFANDRNARLIADAQEFNVEQERLAKLLEQENKLLAEKQQLEDAAKLKGGEIGGVTGAEISVDNDVTGDLKSAELQAIEDRFKSEQQLLAEKYEHDKEILDLEVEDLAERNELKAQLAQELADKLFAIDAERMAKEEKLKAKADKKQRDLDKLLDKQAKDNAKRDEKMANDGMALANIVFEDNKAVSSGIALVNTAQGITKALASQDYAGAALTAVMGAAQIAAINSASKGGGSSVSAPSAPPPAQQNFEPETANLDVIDASATGVQNIQIEIVGETELAAAMGKAIKVADSQGLV